MLRWGHLEEASFSPSLFVSASRADRVEDVVAASTGAFGFFRSGALCFMR